MLRIIGYIDPTIPSKDSSYLLLSFNFSIRAGTTAL